MAARMRELLSHSNALQQFVTENNLQRRSVAKWVDINHDYLDFPSLDDNTLRLLALGTYQLKLTGSYIQEHIGSDCNLQLYREMEGLIRVRLQSRHVSSRLYLIWIRYDSDHIIGWYCRCKCGARTVGTNVLMLHQFCGTLDSKSRYLGNQVCKTGDNTLMMRLKYQRPLILLTQRKVISRSNALFILK
ncbi:hypothetical protein DPMN_021864 [Dreissena polymorpha]|uniref:Uncharacterized protein n=1 Tax=Dreissena polymorpha TaxID=45954 RepID=A0A9D4NNH5_DREPO|nr:hypothetical protein DPMN_021864 [Dreissena polymorpha]